MVSSATNRESVKASYTVTYTLTVEVNHDATSGRSIESLADDIADALLEEDYNSFWEDFPQVDGVFLDRVSIDLMKD